MHAIASSQPPPSAKPLIAAIDGLPKRLEPRKHRLAAEGERSCRLRRQRRQLRNVRAGHERAIAGTSDDQASARRDPSRASSRTLDSSSRTHHSARSAPSDDSPWSGGRGRPARRAASRTTSLDSSSGARAARAKPRDQPREADRNRRANRVGSDVGDVRRPAGHERLMEFVGDAVEDAPRRLSPSPSAASPGPIAWPAPAAPRARSLHTVLRAGPCRTRFPAGSAAGKSTRR